VDGVRHTRLKLDRPLPHTPRIGDKIESVFEVADESMLYLILLCARSAWTKRGMFKSVGAIGPNLAEQHREFVKHNQPRQQQEPKRIRKSLRRRQFGFGRASFELDNTLLYI
jgi:hypothetical protein